MSDIVERLRKAKLYAGHGELSDMPEEAADEIVRLRVENDALAKSCAAATENNERLCAEVERLRSVLKEIADKPQPFMHAVYIARAALEAAHDQA